ncbi:RluA family pseudouridine synthase [Mycoplasma phocimorsus]|uniref:RluA family pseudouridine synthase n=1 Tax=Mycoplasma phocimorsus TaxID=3045839 RepID=UPI0024C03037|nr:RluA family pseudouridine synthase [Mycoplasma phocimorsus]MDJ1646178.1 RluA family pseudouridine synthase [Mycoplasma phocimorsus]
MKKIIATNNDEDRTLYKFIEKYFTQLPQSFIYKLIRNKDIKINSKRVNDARYKIKNEDIIEIYIKDDINFKEYKKANWKVKKVYEDDNILIVNKPKNVEVHDGENSLDNAVKTTLFYKQDDSFIPSHIGRLDKETSGLIIYAKNYKTLTLLNQNINNIKKIYTFISNKKYEKRQYKINIKKDEKSQKMIVTNDSDSLEAITTLWSEREYNFAQIHTGRKHQIRVLLSYLKDPILGDRKYGGKTRPRMYLHCYKLEFSNFEGHLKYLNKKIIKFNPEWWGK